MPTYIYDKHAIAHNKVMVLDGATVITGSFNSTKSHRTPPPPNAPVLSAEVR